MGDGLRLAIMLMALFLFLLAILWSGLPVLLGLPWVPSKGQRIRRALEMAGLRAGETLVDLGAGDGRVLIAAARDFGARAVGIEIEPVHCAIAWLWAIFAGVGRRVTIRCGDLFKVDLKGADVVYLYVRARHAARVRKVLESELRQGARVVSIAVDLPGWEPNDVDMEELIFLYRFPPAQGGLEDFLLKQVEAQ
jgi:SAM-dependent methyltransferase